MHILHTIFLNKIKKILLWVCKVTGTLKNGHLLWKDVLLYFLFLLREVISGKFRKFDYDMLTYVLLKYVSDWTGM